MVINCSSTGVSPVFQCMWEAAGYLLVHWDPITAGVLAFPETLASRRRKKKKKGGTLTGLACHPSPADVTFAGAVPVDPAAAFPVDASARCGERWRHPGQGSGGRQGRHLLL